MPPYLIAMSVNEQVDHAQHLSTQSRYEQKARATSRHARDNDWWWWVPLAQFRNLNTCPVALVVAAERRGEALAFQADTAEAQFTSYAPRLWPERVSGGHVSEGNAERNGMVTVWPADPRRCVWTVALPPANAVLDGNYRTRA
jgi:hypothetical protein